MTQPESPRRWRWIEDERPAGDPRRRVLIQVLVMALIGLLLDRWLGHRIAAIVVWSLAGLVLVLGFAAPKAFGAVERFMQAFGRIVGAVLTWVLLVPVFVLIFAPAGVILRLRGKDPMHRRMRDASLSYWIPRRSTFEAESYARQFLVEDRAARDVARPVSASANGGER